MASTRSPCPTTRAIVLRRRDREEHARSLLVANVTGMVHAEDDSQQQAWQRRVAALNATPRMLESCRDHVCDWNRVLDTWPDEFRDSISVDYESLLDDPLSELNRLLLWIGLPAVESLPDVTVRKLDSARHIPALTIH